MNLRLKNYAYTLLTGGLLILFLLSTLLLQGCMGQAVGAQPETEVTETPEP